MTCRAVAEWDALPDEAATDGAGDRWALVLSREWDRTGVDALECACPTVAELNRESIDMAKKPDVRPKGDKKDTGGKKR